MVHLVLILVQALFASLAIAGKVAMRELSASALVMIRVAGATTALAALVALRGGARLPRGADLRRFAVLAFLGITANQTLFLLGLAHTSAINATILVTTIPVLVVLVSRVTASRSAVPRPLARDPQLAGVLVALAGVVYLIGPDRITVDRDTALGNLLVVLGMVCYAVYLVRSRELVQRHDPLAATLFMMAFGTLFMLPLGGPALARTDPAAVRWSTWAWAAYIVIGPTLLTYLLNLWALKRASSSLVAVYIYLQPVFTAVAAPLFLAGEGLTPRGVVAAVVIFTGVGLVIRGETSPSETLERVPA